MPFLDRLSITIPTVSTNSLGYGAFLGLYANLRYQLLCGVDRAMINHFDVIGVTLFFSTVLRYVFPFSFINSSYGNFFLCSSLSQPLSCYWIDFQVCFPFLLQIEAILFFSFFVSFSPSLPLNRFDVIFILSFASVCLIESFLAYVIDSVLQHMLELFFFLFFCLQLQYKLLPCLFLSTPISFLFF